jgi:hypothetical protein
MNPLRTLFSHLFVVYVPFPPDVYVKMWVNLLAQRVLYQKPPSVYSIKQKKTTILCEK